MAKYVPAKFEPEQIERLAVTLEELAQLIRSQPDRIVDLSLSWDKQHPPYFVDDETYKNAPVRYAFELTLAPLRED